MRKNLRSTCLLFLVFLFFISGSVGIGSAKVDPYDYLRFNFSEKEIVGTIKPPMTSYPIWGYKDKDYTFFANYTASPEDLPNITMVFYWDWSKNSYEYNSFLLNNSSYFVDDTAYTNDTRKCSHAWNETGNYSVAVGIFKLNSRGQWEGENVSYWIPIEIRNNTTIIVENFSMLDEDEGFGCSNSTYNVLSLDNSSKNYSCGYVDNDYSFSVKLNATSQSSADNRTINETTTVVYWNYSTSNSSNSDKESDNSILGNIDYKSVTIKNMSSAKSVTWDRNFTHEWNETGEKNINATAFHWDPLDGSEMYLNYNNTSILIIPDPKNLVSYPIIGNLQNWGILLSILGLVIFYFTYTRNNVAIKIALFGMKPFYLKSVNSLTGTLIFVAGMYLWFVFGRCPWDIPIVSSMDWLSNMYFNMLYHEYETKQHFGVPYLSILIGLLDVIILSLIIHLIAIPFYKGEFKIGEFLRRKLSSTSAQPELVSYSVEDKINQEN